jgi:hypothetical protein
VLEGDQLYPKPVPDLVRRDVRHFDLGFGVVPGLHLKDILMDSVPSFFDRQSFVLGSLAAPDGRRHERDESWQ